MKIFILERHKAFKRFDSKLFIIEDCLWKHFVGLTKTFYWNVKSKRIYSFRILYGTFLSQMLFGIKFLPLKEKTFSLKCFILMLLNFENLKFFLKMLSFILFLLHFWFKNTAFSIKIKDMRVKNTTFSMKMLSLWINLQLDFRLWWFFLELTIYHLIFIQSLFSITKWWWWWCGDIPVKWSWWWWWWLWSLSKGIVMS